jgi:hypothetical protein
VGLGDFLFSEFDGLAQGVTFGDELGGRHSVLQRKNWGDRDRIVTQMVGKT